MLLVVLLEIRTEPAPRCHLESGIIRECSRPGNCSSLSFLNISFSWITRTHVGISESARTTGTTKYIFTVHCSPASNSLLHDGMLMYSIPMKTSCELHEAWHEPSSQAHQGPSGWHPFPLEKELHHSEFFSFKKCNLVKIELNYCFKFIHYISMYY